MTLLDTHVLVWFVGGIELKSTARSVIQSEIGARELAFSAISAWEIGMLVAKGRLELGVTPKRYFENLLRRPDVSAAVITAQIAELASRLPGTMDGDPADRVIVATAIELKCRLMTRDAQIIAYAKRSRALSVVAC